MRIRSTILLLLATSVATACFAADFLGPQEHSIRIVPDSVHLLIGDRTSLGVEDGDRDRIPAHVVEWVSFGRAIVEVNGEGTLRGVGPGTTAVVARHRDAQATAHVTISELLLGGVASGRLHSCGWEDGGPAYCWGYNSHGQLGSDAGERTCGGAPCHFHPVRVSGVHSFTHLAAGAAHTCAITTHSTALCWGSNEHGQLGVGTISGADQVHDVPRNVAGEQSFTTLTNGATHTCALTPEGVPYCWGRNEDGQLGDGTRQTRAAPVKVATDLQFTDLTAGLGHTCGLTTSGAAYCWGSNAQRQLGTVSSRSSTVPVAVEGDRTMTDIAAGDAHTCGISRTSLLAYCWGANSAGQLGNGTTLTRATPSQVDGGQFAAIAAGGFHTCGIAPDGRISCWGSNDYRQLGDETDAAGARPRSAPVTSARAFSSISAGWLHTCTSTSGGATQCWGYNGAGQLGRDDVTSTCPSETSQNCSRRPFSIFGSR